MQVVCSTCVHLLRTCAGCMLYLCRLYALPVYTCCVPVQALCSTCAGCMLYLCTPAAYLCRLYALPVQVVSEVDGDEHAGRRRVDAHVVHRVVEELGARVPLDVVRVVVAPPQLDVQPILLRRRVVHRVSDDKTHASVVYGTHNRTTRQATRHSCQTTVGISVHRVVTQ